MIDYGYCGPECPNSPVASQCIAAKGYGGQGKRCVFPAYYAKKYYLGCVNNYCPTTVVKYGKGTETEWGTCGKKDSCDKDECITVGGARSGQTCKFPFRNPWTNEMHHACTTARLEEEEGSKNQFPSAPWCAVDTNAEDMMVSKNWGFCSKKCPVEKGNNCYVVGTGYSMVDMDRCIFPFVYNGLTYNQCTYIKGYLKCPVTVNMDGVAEEKDMRRCGPSPSCFNATSVMGNPVTFGFIDVDSYSNEGSNDLEIEFEFETGVEDSTQSNWNVDSNVITGFEAFGTSFDASGAGGGKRSASTSSSHHSHTFKYKCPAHTKVVLSQLVFTSGAFKSRTFRLKLSQTKLSPSRVEDPVERFLTNDEIFGHIQSRKM